MDTKPKALTVGELRKALEGLNDAMPVLIRFWVEEEGGLCIDEDDFAIGGIGSATVESSCDDVLAVVLDGGPEVFPEERPTLRLVAKDEAGG